MAGAQPTLTGVTNDASRGGLFDRSNIANPISGADVTGTVINDSTIMITLNYADGTNQTQQFTTNQASDGTLTFTVPGSTTTGGSGGEVTDGTFDAMAGTITLNRQGLSPVVITGVTFNQRSDADINALADARITANTTIVRSVNGVAANDATGAITVPTGTVGLDNFESSDTVVFRQGVTDTSDISADARPTWTGNANLHPSGTTPVTGGVQVQNLTIGADTGLVLVDTGSGTYTLRAQRTLVDAAAPTVTAPPAMSALDPAPEQTITYRPQGTDMVTDISNVGVTTPPGVTVTPTTDTTGGVGTITIPAGETNTPFMYEVTSMVTTTSADGETTTTMEENTIDRFLPYFQLRTEPTTATQVLAGTASSEGWPTNGSFVVGPAGRGTLWLAVADGLIPDNVLFADQGGFPVRVAQGRTPSITLDLPGGATQNYDIFRFQAGQGTTISNFRQTR